MGIDVQRALQVLEDGEMRNEQQYLRNLRIYSNAPVATPPKFQKMTSEGTSKITAVGTVDDRLLRTLRLIAVTATMYESCP